MAQSLLHPLIEILFYRFSFNCCLLINFTLTNNDQKPKNISNKQHEHSIKNFSFKSGFDRVHQPI